MRMELLNPPESGKSKGTVLVTGHTGFKGSWLTMLLHRIGFEVVGISLPPEKNALYQTLEPKNRPSKEYFIDIRERDSLKKAISQHSFKYAVHLAAQPLVLKSYAYPEETFETNVIGTANVLSALIQQKDLKAIGVVTTDKVYLNLNKEIRFTELDQLGGKDPYSASKVGTESVTDAWRQISAIQKGPRIISLRAGNVIGGGDFSPDRLLPDIVRSYLDGTPLKVRNFCSTRPWQHVLDPLIGYYLALAKSSEHGHDSFNFGPLEPSLNVSKVIEESINFWGKALSVEPTGSNSEVEALTLELDSTRAISVLGWKPHLNQVQAIKSTIDWWKDNQLGKRSPGTLCDYQINEAINSYL